MSEHASERELRSWAQYQGLRLEKSRARDPRNPAFGTYQLINGPGPGGYFRSRELVAGDPNTGYGLTLAEVARVLSRDS